VPPKEKKKNENGRKFKNEETTAPELSSDHFNQILEVPTKPRINH
jgi:hypothetical protein